MSPLLKFALRAGRALAALLVLCALWAQPALCAGARPGQAPGAENATAQEAATASGKAQEKARPEDPDMAAQAEALRSYYRYTMTLDERLPGLFSRRVRGREELALEAMRQTQARRGVLKMLAGARVYLDELVFERIEQAPDMARWKVRGTYHVAVSSAFESVAEDALFVLLPEDGGWKIWERRDN